MYESIEAILRYHYAGLYKVVDSDYGTAVIELLSHVAERKIYELLCDLRERGPAGIVFKIQQPDGSLHELGDPYDNPDRVKVTQARQATATNAMNPPLGGQVPARPPEQKAIKKPEFAFPWTKSVQVGEVYGRECYYCAAVHPVRVGEEFNNEEPEHAPGCPYAELVEGSGPVAHASEDDVLHPLATVTNPVQYDPREFTVTINGKLVDSFVSGDFWTNAMRNTQMVIKAPRVIPEPV